jgi:hypothetical protein
MWKFRTKWDSIRELPVNKIFLGPSMVFSNVNNLSSAINKKIEYK